MVCLVRAGSVADGVPPVCEEAFVAGVQEGVSLCALAGVAVGLGAPAVVSKCPAHCWIEFADFTFDLQWDGAVVVGMPELAVSVAAGAGCVVGAEVPRCRRGRFVALAALAVRPASPFRGFFPRGADAFGGAD